jgi:exopolysaccharide biosynthesis polyprenyl glycosylphosphotransferase
MSRPAQKGTAQPSSAPAPAPPSGNPVPPGRLALRGPEGLRRRGAVLRRLLAAGDWAALIVALCIATASTSSTDVAVLFWAVMFSPAWILVLKLHGLYDNDHRRIRHSTLDELSSLISASVLGMLVIDGLLALGPTGPLSPQSAILVGALSFLGCFASRGVIRFLWHRLTSVAAGLVIGPEQGVGMIARRVATHPEARLHLVGYLALSAADPGGDSAELPRLGSVPDISRVAAEYDVERVIVTEREMSEPAAERLIEECKELGLALTFLPQHFGLLGPGIELNRLAELPVLDFRFSDPPRSTLVLKRTMDIVVSALALILLTPLLLVVSIMILVDSGRPVFFRQRRVGRDGALFTMVKFRTMGNDAEERLGDLVDLGKLEQPAFKIANDPRVTRVGRKLRRFSLDEVPQFFNVLKGEMSLVGPRPEEEAVVALYDERQRGRLAVKPGMTGPMQVYGRSDLTFEERLAMDRDYLDNLSVLTDLMILLRTPAAIVRGDGAY